MNTLNNKRNIRSVAQNSGHENPAHQGRLARIARKAYGVAVEHGTTLFNYRDAQYRRNRI